MSAISAVNPPSPATCPGLTIHEIRWSEEKFTLEILRLLSRCPHRRRLTLALGMNEEEGAVALYREMSSQGNTYVADSGHGLVGVLHLTADPLSTHLGMCTGLEIKTLLLDPEAPPDTLDALLDGMIALTLDPLDALFIRVPTGDDGTRRSLLERGFTALGVESIAIAPCHAFPKPIPDPHLSISLLWPGEVESALDLTRNWMERTDRHWVPDHAKGPSLASAQRFLRKFASDRWSSILLARDAQGLSLGMLWYRYDQADPQGSALGGVIELVEIRSRSNGGTQVEIRLHQEAVRRLHEQGCSHAILRSSWVSSESFREDRVARFRLWSQLHHLGYEFVSFQNILRRGVAGLEERVGKGASWTFHPTAPPKRVGDTPIRSHFPVAPQTDQAAF